MYHVVVYKERAISVASSCQVDHVDVALIWSLLIIDNYNTGRRGGDKLGWEDDPSSVK